MGYTNQNRLKPPRSPGTGEAFGVRRLDAAFKDSPFSYASSKPEQHLVEDYESGVEPPHSKGVVHVITDNDVGRLYSWDGDGCLFGVGSAGTDQRHDQTGARPETADRRGVYEEDPRIYDRDIFQLAIDRLFAGFEDGADAEGRPRRCRGGAGQVALFERGLSLYAD